MNITRVLYRGFTTSSAKLNLKDSKLYEHHIPLTNLQKLLLAAGSGLGAIIDPYRHDLVADFGETTGHRALVWMKDRMTSSSEGRRVLEGKPRLRSDRINYDKLRSMPENTFGHQYARFYSDNKVSPDTRKTVQFVDDAELAYVMQRYRELHDIVHTVLSQPTTIKGELLVKAFEGIQTRLPLCVLGGLVGPVKLNRQELVEYLSGDLTWALKCGRDAKSLMNVYFEERFEQDLGELRSEMNIKLQK